MKLLKTLILPLKAMLIFAIFWFLFKHSQLQFNLFYAFIANPFSTFIIFALFYLMIIVHAWRWHVLNSIQSLHQPFSLTLLSTYICIALNNVLPGNTGGDLFRLYFVVKKFPDKKSKAILSVLLDRINGLLGVLVITCLISIYYLDKSHHNSTLFYLLMVCAAICITTIGLFFIVTLFSDKIHLPLRIKNQLARLPLSNRFASVFDALKIYRHSKLIIFQSVGLSMVTQFLILGTVILISKSMNLPPISPFIYLLALAVAQIANLIPLTPGGIGVGEAAFANIILLLSPDAPAAYATVFFALRLLSTLAYLPGVFIGIFGMHWLHEKPSAAAY